MRKTLLLCLFLCLGYVLNAQTNLISNHDFEDGSISIGKQSTDLKTGQNSNKWVHLLKDEASNEGTVSISNDDKYEGNNSLKLNLVKINARYRFYISYELTNLTPRKYTYSFYAKANAATNIRVEVHPVSASGVNIDNDGKYLIGTSVSGKAEAVTTEWTKYTYEIDASTFTADELKYVNLVIRPNCNQGGNVTNTPTTYWFDDFEFFDPTETTEPDLSKSLLINPGFENTSISIGQQVSDLMTGQNSNKWVHLLKDATNNIGTVAISNGDKYEGNNSLKVDITKIGARYNFYMAYELTDLKPAKYTYSFYAKAGAATYMRVEAYATAAAGVKIDADAVYLIGGTANGKAESITSDWTKYTYEIDATGYTEAQLKHVNLVLRPNCNSGGNVVSQPVPITFWLDNFMFYDPNATEEPVSAYPLFASISDIHVGRSGWETKVTNALTILAAQSPKLDAIFIVGDITENGKETEFQDAKAKVEALIPSDIPVYYNLGNHDWWGNRTGETRTAKELFETVLGQDVNQYIEIKGYPFILISMETQDQNNAYLADTRTFLTEKLQKAATDHPGKPIFVFQHIPNAGTVYGSFDIGGGDAWGTGNVDDILSLYPQVIALSGHSHYFLADERSIHQNNYTSINDGSVAYAETENGLVGGTRPTGSEKMQEGVIIYLDENNNVTVKRLDLYNNVEIKQPWVINAPHDGTVFAYKNRDGGTAPYFESGAAITLGTPGENSIQVTFSIAKDDDAVQHYRVEVLDSNSQPLSSPVYKVLSKFYLYGNTEQSLSTNIAGLDSDTEYFVQVKGVDAFGKETTPPLLSSKFRTAASSILYTDNLFQNPGFENNETIKVVTVDLTTGTNTITNKWVHLLKDATNNVGTVSIVNDDKFDGSNSMKLDLTKIGARYNFYIAYEFANLKPGKYVYSFYAKGSAAAIPFRVEVSPFSASGVKLESTTVSLIGATGSSSNRGKEEATTAAWTKYSYEFDLSSYSADDLKYVEFYIRPNCKQNGTLNTAATTYWFDNFYLAREMDPRELTDYTFEDNDLTNWTSTAGSTIAVSADHYKEGTKAMKWETAGEASLQLDALYTTNRAASFYMYSSSITDEQLRVEFREGTTVKKTANILLNFKGWRSFDRAYSEYESASVDAVDNVVFTRVTDGTAPLALYFDDIHLDKAIDANRQFGYHMLPDRQYYATGTASLDVYANAIDIASTAPTAEETTAINSLFSTLKLTPKAGTTEELTAARSYVAALNIERNSDNSVKGNPINLMSAFTDAYMTTLSRHIEVLAASTTGTDATLLNDLVDYIIDQGLTESVYYTLPSSSYSVARSVPKSLLSAMNVYTNTQKTEILKMVRWISNYGNIYDTQDSYIYNINGDVVYNFIANYYLYAIYQPSAALQNRELKALTRYMARTVEDTPGGCGMIKPDGVGYHHKAHYNQYMYAYKSWIEYAAYLSGTPYKVSEDAYKQMKKAVEAMYTMATNGTDDNHFTANSVGGRNVYAKGGLKVPVVKADFKKLLDVSKDFNSGSVDSELAAAYNYFFKTTEYTGVEASDYAGFYQYNYSPIGVYRAHNWVTTMRAPTTKSWGAEIYSATNRFGRYQSHGSLEVMYEGTLDKSGYPIDATSGGWDWNVIPGTTTVHYSDWTKMMPSGNATQRFDQYTKTKNFAGALSAGDYGIFVSDFDQIDSWGTQVFEPTNLEFKKSVFAFDDILVCLGSDINASGSYDSDMITATNLFQGIVTASSSDFIVNGSPVSTGYDNTIQLGTAGAWFVTPQTTGYYLPKGNNELILKYGMQTTPKQDGSDAASPTTTVTAAKAYINHGVKTTGNEYEFVVVPGTNSTSMASVAQKLGNNELYEVKAKTSAVHAVTYKPTNTTAYSIFEANNNLNIGLIKEATSQMLVVVTRDEMLGKAKFIVNNPNLNPIADNRSGWVATPTVASIILGGVWTVQESDPSVSISPDAATQTTTVEFTLKDGNPVAFELFIDDDDYRDASLTGLKIDGQDWNIANVYNIPCQFEGDKVTVEVETLTGATVNKGNTFTIDIPSLPSDQTIPFVITARDGSTKATYNLHVVRPMIESDNLIIQKWNNALIVNNNSTTNGGYTFTKYKWTKNGIEVGSNQVYTAPAGLDMNAEYNVELTTGTGTSYKTCPAQLTRKSLMIKAYPNPAVVSGTICVETELPEEIINTTKATIYSTSGTPVSNAKLTGSQTYISLPSVAGTYVLKVVGNGVNQEFKLLVK